MRRYFGAFWHEKTQRSLQSQGQQEADFFEKWMLLRRIFLARSSLINYFHLCDTWRMFDDDRSKNLLDHIPHGTRRRPTIIIGIWTGRN